MSSYSAEQHYYPRNDYDHQEYTTRTAQFPPENDPHTLPPNVTYSSSYDQSNSPQYNSHEYPTGGYYNQDARGQGYPPPPPPPPNYEDHFIGTNGQKEQGTHHQPSSVSQSSQHNPWQQYDRYHHHHSHGAPQAQGYYQNDPPLRNQYEGVNGNGQQEQVSKVDHTYRDFSGVPPTDDDRERYLNKKKEYQKRLRARKKKKAALESSNADSSSTTTDPTSPDKPVKGRPGGGSKKVKNNGDAFIGFMGTNFPARLHDLLSYENGISDVITWLPHGRSWIVLDKVEFLKRVAPYHFQISKFESFTRQVNGWGFKRITQGPDVNSYYHEMFLCGMPHLIQWMKRSTPAQKGRRKIRADPKDEPNFYEISQMYPLPNYYQQEDETCLSGGSGGDGASDRVKNNVKSVENKVVVCIDESDDNVKSKQQNSPPPVHECKPQGGDGDPTSRSGRDSALATSPRKRTKQGTEKHVEVFETHRPRNSSIASMSPSSHQHQQAMQKKSAFNSYPYHGENDKMMSSTTPEDGSAELFWNTNEPNNPTPTSSHHNNHHHNEHNNAYYPPHSRDESSLPPPSPHVRKNLHCDTSHNDHGVIKWKPSIDTTTTPTECETTVSSIPPPPPLPFPPQLPHHHHYNPQQHLDHHSNHHSNNNESDLSTVSRNPSESMERRSSGESYSHSQNHHQPSSSSQQQQNHHHHHHHRDGNPEYSNFSDGVSTGGGRGNNHHNHQPLNYEDMSEPDPWGNYI